MADPTTTGQRRAALSGLLDAANALSGEHDLDAVLRQIVETAASIGGARYAAMAIYDRSGKIETFIHHGIDQRTAARIGRPPTGVGLLGEVIAAAGPVRVDDMASDPRSCGFPDGHPPMRSFLGVPVGRRGNRYGNLYLTEKIGGDRFDETDEALVATFAAFAAGAIESARLVAAEREQVDAVAGLARAEEADRARRRMLKEILRAQEAERARVARDLHDDVGQALTSVLLGLHLLESDLASPGREADTSQRLTELRELVSDALERARRLAFDLRPTVLDDMGLVPALEHLVTQVADRSGLAVDIATPGLGGRRLPPVIETVAYRVVQEALTNVVRHSRAGSVSVTAAVSEGRLRALVEDDGIGFEPGSGDGHLGIEGMVERAGLAGGTLEIISAPGRGTTIRLELPVD